MKRCGEENGNGKRKPMLKTRECFRLKQHFNYEFLKA